ncbi:receptor-like serine/threonine-protein kinase SD1-8 [Tanacetum coccineum]
MSLIPPLTLVVKAPESNQQFGSLNLGAHRLRVLLDSWETNWVFSIWLKLKHELKDKQLRMEDAVNATKREEGVVVGGGCCLLRLSLKVNEIKKFMDYEEQKIWAGIFKRALEYPARQIAKNGGVNGSVVIEKIFSNDDVRYGYNDSSNEYEDLKAVDIIGPTKVFYKIVATSAKIDNSTYSVLRKDLLAAGNWRKHAFDYVYNPSTNLLKILPEPDYANVDSNVYGCAGLRLAFDPTKSPYYKVVRAGRTCSDIFIQIYCSEKGNWSLCNERFNYFFFLHFDSAMYWNNALHWLETENSQLTHYKLNIEYPDHPIITIIQVPQSLQQGRNFFKSYGNILPMIITIQIPHILHLKGKLFDSRGCLLLVRRDDFGSNKFTIYEMMKGSSVWSVRYHVDTDDFMTPLPEGWSIRFTVWSIVLGEMEDDSFLVINLSGKVVEYNLISKNLREMYDMESYQLTDVYHDGFIPHGFIPPFAMYDMRPKQVDHKVYEFIP